MDSRFGNPAGESRESRSISMSKETKRSVVVAAGEVTSRDGVTHKQGTKVSLPDVEARDLLRLGVVRDAAVEPAKSNTKEA